jgi:hypothetical protein
MTARSALGAVVVSAGLVLAGCGEDAPPTEDVPSLAEDLQRVDDAIVGRDFEEAATALDDIEAATRAARDDGTLSEAEADRILAAVKAMREALATRETPPTTPESSPTETSPPTSDEGEGDDDDEEDEEGGSGPDKKDKGKHKGPDGPGPGGDGDDD